MDTSHEANVPVFLRDARNALHEMKHSSHRAQSLVEIGLDAIDDATEETAASSYKTLLTDSGINTVLDNISNFIENSKILINVLEEISKVHPFIQIALIPFKAIVALEVKRRENDNRKGALYWQMHDMMATLRLLAKLNSSQTTTDNGLTIEDRMRGRMIKIADDIKACANACDVLQKRTLVVRVLTSISWEPRLQAFADCFTEHKNAINSDLSIFIGFTVKSTSESVNMLLLMERIRSTKELELMKRIEQEGGPEKCMKDDTILKSLVAMSERYNIYSGQKLDDNKEVAKIHQQLGDDLDATLEKNMEFFNRKFEARKKEILTAISDQREVIITRLTSGSHNYINDRELAQVWQIMHWKGTIKARHFVLALRDYYRGQLYGTISERQTTVSEGSATYSRCGFEVDHMEVASPSRSMIAPLDNDNEWELNYIKITNIQPLMEAFDDDASGYVSIAEANEFTKTKPKGWSLRKWIAYWAAGFHKTLHHYLNLCTSLLQEMYSDIDNVLPTNRAVVNRYFTCQPLIKVDMLLAGLFGEADNIQVDDRINAKFEEYIRTEEDRIKNNLESIDYYIDAPDALFMVAGAGRPEKTIMPILYLLLRRHAMIIKLAQSVVLDWRELTYCVQSIEELMSGASERAMQLKALFKQLNLEPAVKIKQFSHGMFQYLDDMDKFYSTRFYSEILKSTYPLQSELETDSNGHHILQFTPRPKERLDLLYNEDSDLSPLPAGTAERQLCGMWDGFTFKGDKFQPDQPLSFSINLPDTDNGSFAGTGFDASGKLIVRGTVIGTNTYDIGIMIYRDAEEVHSHPSDLLTVANYQCRLIDKYILEGHCDSTISMSGVRHSFRVQRRSKLHLLQPHSLRKQSEDSMQISMTSIQLITRLARRRFLMPQHTQGWDWIELRRRIRLEYTELYVRREDSRSGWEVLLSVNSLTQSEEEMLEMIESTISLQDLRYYQSLAWHILRRNINHGVYCDSCSSAIMGTRYVCAVCLPLSETCTIDSVDLCNDCRFYGVDVERENNKFYHDYDHCQIKFRDCLHRKDVESQRSAALRVIDHLEGRFAYRPKYLFDCAADLGSTYQPGYLSHAAVGPGGHDLAAFLDVDKDGEDPLNVLLCIYCEQAIERPCWYCLQCRGNVFICDECDDEHETERPWLYDWKGKPNATTLLSSSNHEWTHPLVSCIPAIKSAIPDPIETRISNLEQRFADFQSKIEAKITARFDTLEALLRQLVNAE